MSLGAEGNLLWNTWNKMYSDSVITQFCSSKKLKAKQDMNQIMFKLSILYFGFLYIYLWQIKCSKRLMYNKSNVSNDGPLTLMNVMITE